MKRLIFILFVCSLFADTINYTYQGEQKVIEVADKPLPLNKIGGGFIVLSGFLLMKTTKGCNTCEPNHEYSTSEAIENTVSYINKMEKLQKNAYMCLIAGGMFLLFDSHIQKVESSNQALNFDFQPTYQGAALTMSYAFD